MLNVLGGVLTNVILAMALSPLHKTVNWPVFDIYLHDITIYSQGISRKETITITVADGMTNICRLSIQ